MISESIPQKTAANVLVGIIGISDYDPGTKDLVHFDEETILELGGVERDIKKHIQLWHKKFGYDTMVLSKYSSSPQSNKTWERRYIYASDVDEFLKKVRRQYVKLKSEADEDKCEEDREYTYDALIIAIMGHGYWESLITSDGDLMPFDKIRHMFAGDEIPLPLARDSLRFFIIDTCRGGKWADIRRANKKILRTRGPPGDEVRERYWVKDSKHNVQSNISTLHTTTIGYSVVDKDASFMNTLDEMVPKQSEMGVPLDDIFKKVKIELTNKNKDGFCPEFVDRNDFKIKLRKRDNKSSKPDAFMYHKLKSGIYSLVNEFEAPKEAKVGRRNQPVNVSGNDDDTDCNCRAWCKKVFPRCVLL